MCGRFTITLDPADLQQELNLGDLPAEWKPRYNVAPTQNIPIVNDTQTRSVQMFRWGLIPSWAKDITIGERLINARSETLREKPSFRHAFANQRCLVLADGFFEWQQRNSKTPKVPMYFQLLEAKPFAFAGLWEYWEDAEHKGIHSCTIITCEPNTLVAQVHNRMPVILDKDTCWKWLEAKDLSKLQTMLAPYPAEKMHSYSVGRYVNNLAYDSVECIQPLAF